MNTETEGKALPSALDATSSIDRKKDLTMTANLDEISEDLIAELPDDFRLLFEGDTDADTIADLIFDVLFDEEEEIYEDLIRVETALLLEHSTEALKEKGEITKRRNVLRRLLDHLLATPCAVERDHAPTLAFRGRLVGEVSSQRGKVPRWTELRLYRTHDGRYVAEDVGVTTKHREQNFRRTDVLEDDAEVISFFGNGSLSREIYDQAGIVAVVAL